MERWEPWNAKQTTEDESLQHPSDSMMSCHSGTDECMSMMRYWITIKRQMLPHILE